MRLEHRLDPRRGRAAVEPGDNAPIHHQREGRHLPHAEPLGEVRPVVDVDLADAEPAALLPRDVREQALHPPGRAGAVRGEEHEQRAFVGGHVEPPNGLRRQRTKGARGYGSPMGSWYWIGVSAGLGAAIGVALAGPAGAGRSWRITVVVMAGAAGAGIGFGIASWQSGGWGDRLAGILGGLAGSLGAVQVVSGALRRGGTRGGTATLVSGAALAVAAAAWIPVVGYLEALALPALAARLRRTQPERYAGLRTLARDE